MADNRRRFIKAIISFSKADNYKDAIQEWQVVEVMEGENQCICGQKLTAQYVIIYNTILKHHKIIGINCAEHVKDAEYKKAKELNDKLHNPHLFCDFCQTKMRHEDNGAKIYCPECRKEERRKKKIEDDKVKTEAKFNKLYEKIIKQGQEKRISVGKYNGMLYQNVYNKNSTYHTFVKDNAQKKGYKTYIKWAYSYDKLKEEMKEFIKNN